MRGPQDDDVARHPAPRDRRDEPPPSSALRTSGLVAGFVLAVAATAVVFLTDNPQHLRLAVIAAAWAFVLAAFLAGRRRAETQAAAEREAELRRGYQHELDREAAAHRAYELELENELRREAEQSMRAELTALRQEIAGLSGLRDEVARVSSLRDEVARVSALRDDVAGLAALRSDVASLSALREDLTQLAELRADMGRLRAELTEQLNGEMLVERILLRTQSIRTPADAGTAETPRTVEAPAMWEDDRPPRELTGGWPAVRLDDLPETRQAERVRVDRPLPGSRPAAASWTVEQSAAAWSTPSWERTDPAPGTAAFPPAPAPAAPAPPVTARPTPPAPPPPTPLEWLADRALVEPADTAPRRSRHAAAEQADHPPRHETPAWQEVATPPADRQPPVPQRRRRTDEPLDDRTEERPAAPATSYEPIVRPSPSPRPSPRPRPTPAPAPVHEEADSAGHRRLAEILADREAQPPSGGRRRRRYRDEDEPDDVLARVLGQN
ncbi:DUF6779 domain-containing protein [Geodermatophilus sp. URMC 64]